MSFYPRHQHQTSGILDIDGYRLGEVECPVTGMFSPELKSLPSKVIQTWESSNKCYTKDRLYSVITEKLQEVPWDQAPWLRFRPTSAVLDGIPPTTRSVTVTVDDFHGPGSPHSFDIRETELLFRPIAGTPQHSNDIDNSDIIDHHIPKTFSLIRSPRFPSEKQFSTARASEIERWYAEDNWHYQNLYNFPTAWVTPPATEIGDLIVFVRGGLMPIVLRKRPDSPFWRYIGPATIAGIIPFEEQCYRGDTHHFHVAREWFGKFTTMMNNCIEDGSLEHFELS